MRSSYQGFIDALLETTDAATLGDALADLTSTLGFPLFAYISGGQPSRRLPTLISNYAVRWTDHYLKSRYDKLDPIIEVAGRATEPFFWNDGALHRLLTKPQQAFFEEAKGYGIAAGLTIPLGSHGQPIAALTFASDVGLAAIRETAERHRSALQLLGLLVHRRAKAFMSRGYAVGGVRLSRREYQCLMWASRGKSAWEISRILTISQRTVESYCEAIREKLRVHTMTQAAVIFARSQKDQDLI